jgi:hypothetical protein
LRNQFLDRVFDLFRIATIAKTGGEPAHNSRPLLYFSQQQGSGLAADGAAIKTGHHLALKMCGELEARLMG